MAKNVNINRAVNDPFYRYKMPRVIAKVEGKGNGIKTVIANMSEIAKALARPPTYPTKYFGCELGAQTNFDLKNDRYIVNGEHDANKLQDILDGFIKKFVLCPSCENPETTLSVKRQTIQGKCKACGYSFTVDPKQKLSTFIMKNPPPPEAETDAKEKRDSPTLENGTNGEDRLSPVINGKEVHNNNEADDDWAPEPTDAPDLLPSQIGKLVIVKDLEKTMDERLDMLHSFFIAARNDCSIEDNKKIVNEAERLELKTKAPLLLADALFDEDVVNQIKTYRNLLLRFCLNDKKAQKYLLGGIEQLIFKYRQTLLPKTGHIIKALYDNDVCEEETILTWGAKPSSKYVAKDFSKELMKIADPVLTWLKEAEEDTAEEDDDVVDFNDRARVIGDVAVVSENKAVADKPEAVIKDENGEEIDIDDI